MATELNMPMKTSTSPILIIRVGHVPRSLQETALYRPRRLVYEWQALDPKRKKTQSWAIARKDRKLFGMAGLWESWNIP
jgi:hypothetical protein